jgi:hypothetical protein
VCVPPTMAKGKLDLRVWFSFLNSSSWKFGGKSFFHFGGKMFLNFAGKCFKSWREKNNWREKVFKFGGKGS